ncbi:RsmE family RNA methyltransferase [Seleniivibrio woodruffii]|uniref:Ribosomal RNA small subunit methyltransferase E n=1 Tax=Seleniivibrio woodruffii TaxID=1078050 RepID=A0A4R1KA77_9BACT|nr:RsmE family RNA methyltransferase [Seleniivibrio woodruffii]TCK60940.1 16S rRNA (uracil1498-N3)-methyltransferase [Seleniivibrio woodruffii]TVZ36570.1 16S rRNA (uracil1498-N3)-methyltransferase [Seleniivibrio woodruffii]
MKRIFYEGMINDVFSLEGDVFHYLKNVVRAKEGDTLGVLTPSQYAECTITELGKRSASVHADIVRETKRHDYRLTVYQCLLKREYMDFAVEKYSELGATEIVPVVSRRSLNELKDKTRDRFTDIAVKAVLQSENEQLPVIADSIDISDITPCGTENIVFYERAETMGMPPVSKDMSIVIGPEGGFTEEEISMLAAKGFKIIKPVSQILKAETASVVFTGYVRMMQDNI